MSTLTIVQASKSVIDAFTTGKPVLEKVASYMDAAEKLKDSSLTGSEKRSWVIEYAKKEIVEVFKDLDYWVPLIIKFINAIKTAFNAVKVLF